MYIYHSSYTKIVSHIFIKVSCLFPHLLIWTIITIFS
uniref:Uncharacterized protein n=1 Tax=Siphoviridae sp. ctYKh4 TaxID=2823586 RepID=A0A8S5LCI7_9CAUD|nr:MAG TPA: hypothetical protein [Siphoviridae sp. ctYKh4]